MIIDLGAIEQILKEQNLYNDNLSNKGESTERNLAMKVEATRYALGLTDLGDNPGANAGVIAGLLNGQIAPFNPFDGTIAGTIAGINTEGIQAAIDHWAHGRAPVTANDFIEVSVTIGVPVDLMLAQAVQESQIGTSGGRPTATKNMFNVGNTDSGNNKYMNSWKDGIYVYANLIKKHYAPDPNNITAESVILPKFVRMHNGTKSGDRYASDVNYETKLFAIIKTIRNIMGKNITHHATTGFKS
jgi:hypothetical protein